jgi:hypothetical protein
MSDTMNETHIHDPRPLARSEIESVLQLSRETAYVPSEDRPGIKDKSFVKRPLVDIAQAADAPVTPDTSQVSNVSATPAIPEEAEISQNPEAESAPTPGNLDAGADESIAMPEGAAAGGTDLESGETTAGDDDLQATAEGEENDPSPGFEPTPVAQAVIPTDAEIQDRIDEAYARGLSEGDSQARQRLEDGCQRLENLATGLMGQDALDTEELGRHIEETVMRLASLRAGYAIKDLPAPFAEIVEQLVQRISKEANGGTLHLNPSDLAVVQPLLENRDSFGQIGFKADDAIMPGDIRVSVGSVEAEDRLSQRAGLGVEDGGEGTEFDEVGRLMRNLLDEAPNDTHNNAPNDTPETDGEPL